MKETVQKALNQYEQRKQSAAQQPSRAKSSIPGVQRALDDYSARNQRTIDSDTYNRWTTATNYVSKWLEDRNNFFNGANKELSSGSSFDAASYFETRKQQADALKQSSGVALQYLEDNKDAFSYADYLDLRDWLSNFDTEADDLLSSYQQRSNAKAGMRAYEDEILAYQEKMAQQSQATGNPFNMPEITNPVYGFLNMQNQYRGDTSYLGINDNWTDEERFNLGLLQQEDPAKAREYARQVNDYHNGVATEEERKNLRESAVENPWLHTMGALGASTVTGIPEFLDRVAEYTARGTTTEKPGLTAADYSSEVTGGISDNLNQKYGTISDDVFMLGGKGVGDLYNMGYSIGQNILSRYTLGKIGGQPLMMASFFANAATSGIDEARRRGANGAQAMAMGLVSGALEVATEYIPTAELFKMGPAVTIGDLLKNVGIESLEEFVGEGVNAGLGYLADKAIMGDLSEFETNKRAYMEELGLTEDQAQKLAIRDAIGNTLFEGVTGAVSGAVSAGTETGVKTGVANYRFRNADAQQLIDNALTMPETSAAYQNALILQNSLRSGQTISGNQKRELAYNTELAALAQAKVEADEARKAAQEPIATSGKSRAVQISTNQEVDTGDFAGIDEKGHATVNIGENSTADINDINFATETAFRRYNTVLSLPGINTETANEVLHYLNDNGGAEDTDSIIGIRDAYGRGYYGRAFNTNGTDSGLIDGTLAKKMYQIGQKRAADEAQKAHALKAQQPTQATSKEYKKVVFEGKVSELKGKKKASVEMMNFIAENFSGTTVHVFESYTRNGKRYYKDNSGKERVAPNGQYVGNEIWVDLNAGEKGEGLSLNTFGHEMYHHVEKWNKKGAQDLASFLLRELGQKTDIDKAVQAQIAKARRAGYGEKYFTDQGYTRQAAENMVYDRAMSDLVADSLEAVFTHGDPAAALAKLRSEDQGLFDQIKSFVDEWVTKLRKFLKGGTISEEGAIVANLEKFEQIQQMFLDAMDVAGENYRAADSVNEESTTLKDDAKFSDRNYSDFDKPITEEDVAILRGIGRKSINNFTSDDIEKSQKWAYKFIREYGIKSPFLRAWFGEWRQKSTDLISPVKQVKGTLLKNGRAKNKDIGIDMSWNAHEIISETKNHASKDRISVEAIQQLDEIVENAIYLDTYISMPTSKSKMKNTAFMHSFYSLYDTGAEIHLIKLYAEMALNNKGDTVFTRAYQLKDIKKVAVLANGVSGASAPLSYAKSATIKTIADLVEAVKNYDKDYLPNAPSKIVNSDGTPKVMYHGTNYDFTVFDKRKAKTGAFGKGFYFSPSKSVAGMYGTKNNLGVYLNAQNPYVVTDSIGFTAEEYRQIQQELNIKERITDANVHKILAQNGYDGIMVYAQNGQLREVVVFDSNQIKSATDNIGTFDPQNKDINFSLRNAPQDNSGRGILSRINVDSRKTLAEREHLGRYQDRLNQLKDAQARLADAQARMAEKPEKKELLRLQQQERMAKSDISRHKKFLSGLEKTDLFKKMVSEQRLVEYREKQKAKWDAQAEEYRQVRKQLTGADSVISVMEDEFVNLAKAYEDKIIDLKTMEREFIRLAKEYDKTAQEAGQVKGLKEDTAIWQREFRRLMREYDTAGRKIERLEATIERQRQRAAEKVQSRRNTEMRNKIIRRVGELEKMLLRGSKTSYVPEELRKTVSAILDAIDLRKSDKETKVADHLRKLKEEYRKIQQDADTNLYDDGLRGYLDMLTDKVGETKLGDMTREQMDTVYDIVTIVLETIRNANEAFVSGKRQMVSEMSETAMREVRSIGGNKNQGKVERDIVKGLKAFMWNDMRPVDIFNAIGSGQLKELFNSIRKGEDIWATDIREAREFFRQQWQKFKGDSWDMDKEYTFRSASDMEFQLNTEQIMSIYALFRRDKGQAMDHLRQGGFVFDNTVVDKNGKTHSDATAYNLTDDAIMQIIGTLTKDQRAFVEAMQGYLSDTMGAKGNEVSMKMYGIKLFREKNYFPLRSAEQYMERAKAQQRGEVKIKNSGFTKPVTPNANTAIVLSPFLNVWGSHVDEMSNYHAFVLPMEDFYRVYNYRTDVSSEESATRSVQAAIQNAYGEAAVKAIDQLLKDINGGVRGDSTAGIIQKMISKYKKGATMASLSVAVQQPSAILRAAGMIDARYFVGAKPTSSMVGRTWEEIKKYAPIATIKEIGSFDTNTGRTATQYLTGMEYNGFDEKFRAFFKDGAFRDDMLGRLPAFMDEVSWSVIWNSVKREQAAKNPGMDTQSEAFMQKVADRFTDVIVHTQVYDSVLAKNAMMRSKESGMKMVTSFMAEPTVTANMIAGALLNFRRTGDKKALAKTLGSIVAATVVNLAAVSVVYALRDDDEDERFDEKWIASIRNNLFETVSPASYIPILRDMQSIAMGYDVERPDMSVVKGVYEALMSVFDDDIGSWDKVEKVVGAVGNAAGFPAKNLIRDAKGIWNTLRQAYGVKNVSTKTGRQIAWRGEKLDNGEQLLLAIQRGDMAHMERVAARFEDMDKAMGGLMTAIRRQYVEGIMGSEEAKELLMTYNELSEADVYWKLQEWDYAKANGTSEGYTKMGDLMAAVANGEGVEEQIQRYMDNGMDDSDIRSQISREYHEPYLEAGEAGREQIRHTVRNALLAAGSTDADIQDKFKGWDFETEYGMTYSDMIDGYREGEVNRIQLREALEYYGLKNFEINEKLADLDSDIAFRNQYGMSLSEMKELYAAGDITRNQMVSALVYSGKSRNEAQDMVTQMDIQNRTGIAYSKLDDAYRAGDISRNTLYNAIIDNGATQEEADEDILGYDWLKRNANGDKELTITDAKKFAVSLGEKAEYETLEDYGVSVAAYKEYKAKVAECKGVDANGDGKTDSGTLRDEILQMIDSLPISDTAKDGLALLRYSKSSIRKNAPWH